VESRAWNLGRTLSYSSIQTAPYYVFFPGNTNSIKFQLEVSFRLTHIMAPSTPSRHPHSPTSPTSPTYSTPEHTRYESFSDLVHSQSPTSPTLKPFRRFPRTSKAASELRPSPVLRVSGGRVEIGIDTTPEEELVVGGLAEVEGGKKELTTIEMITLTVAMGGAQLTWTVEMACVSLSLRASERARGGETRRGLIHGAVGDRFGTPYLLSMGLSKEATSLVWLAGPLSGLVVQPVIGESPVLPSVSWREGDPAAKWLIGIVHFLLSNYRFHPLHHSNRRRLHGSSPDTTRAPDVNKPNSRLRHASSLPFLPLATLLATTRFPPSTSSSNSPYTLHGINASPFPSRRASTLDPRPFSPRSHPSPSFVPPPLPFCLPLLTPQVHSLTPTPRAPVDGSTSSSRPSSSSSPPSLSLSPKKSQQLFVNSVGLEIGIPKWAGGGMRG
jgi:hypothetical protein